MVTVFILYSGFLLSIGFDFLPLIFIIIYVGAIAILFLFVIMMLNIQESEEKDIWALILILFTLILGVTVNSISSITKGIEWPIEHAWKFDYFEQWQILSSLLYSNFLIVILSLFLLIAMIGTVVLCLEVKILVSIKRQYFFNQQMRFNS